MGVLKAEAPDVESKPFPLRGVGGRWELSPERMARDQRREGLAFATKLEVGMFSRTLAWKIPWTEEPGRLQSMGSLRVGHK